MERVEPAFEPVHPSVVHEGGAGDGELAADVEQGVLDVDETGAHVVVQGVNEDGPDRAVELVHVAHRLNAGRVLVHPRPVTEAGRPSVSGTGVDLRQAVSHACAPRDSLPDAYDSATLRLMRHGARFAPRGTALGTRRRTAEGRRDPRRQPPSRAPTSAFGSGFGPGSGSGGEPGSADSASSRPSAAASSMSTVELRLAAGT